MKSKNSNNYLIQMLLKVLITTLTLSYIETLEDSVCKQVIYVFSYLRVFKTFFYILIHIITLNIRTVSYTHLNAIY